MRQFRRKPSGGKRVISCLFNKLHGTGNIQFNNPMDKFLICAILSTGKNQLKLVEMIVDICNYLRKAVVSKGHNLFFLLI